MSQHPGFLLVPDEVFLDAPEHTEWSARLAAAFDRAGISTDEWAPYRVPESWREWAAEEARRASG